MLKDINGEIAATWSFKGLLEHWNRKARSSRLRTFNFRTIAAAIRVWESGTSV